MNGISRFHVMAILQAARAHALGLDLAESKSWGLNRALFYASAKSAWAAAKELGVRRPHIPAFEVSRQHHDPVYVLGGEKAFRARDLKKGLRFKHGAKVQEPQDFDAQIVAKFKDWQTVWAEALSIVRSADRRDLDINHRFFNHIYKVRRDSLAERWSRLAIDFDGTPRAA